MIRVYVAGPYTDDKPLGVLRNIGRGQYWAGRLFLDGFAPFTPWHDKTFVTDNWDLPMDVRAFYEYSIEWLKVSDCVFVVPNQPGLKNWQASEGTCLEIEEAEALGKPVFFDYESLISFYGKSL